MTATTAGAADPGDRDVENAKVVGRKRFIPPPLNALSSFTVELTPMRRTGTDS
jgi:hypothetical protein